MKRGRMHRPKQYPPNWKNSERVSSHPPAVAHRKNRHAAMGWNSLYEYGTGMNFAMFTGKVIRKPMAAGFKHKEMVWFRLSVPNLDNPGQKLFISVRARGALAHHVWENIARGDEVGVTGRLWSMRMFRPLPKLGPKVWRQVIYVDAERVSGSYPVQLDYDSRYLRVRADLWNRMCSLVPDMAEQKIPARQRRDLMAVWDEVSAMYTGVEPEVDVDMGDPDPSADKEPEDENDAPRSTDG